MLDNKKTRVFSENGDELFFDEQQNLFKTKPKPRLTSESISEFIDKNLIKSKREKLEEAQERFFNEMMSTNPKGNIKTFLNMAIEFGVNWQKKQENYKLTIAKKNYCQEELLSFGKSCFYKGFEKSEKDDANCYTAFREEIGGLFDKNK